MTSQLHRLGLGAQFFGQTPVQVLKSANFKESGWPTVMWVVPVPAAEQRLTSPLKASPSVCGGGLQWEMLPGVSSLAVAPLVGGRAQFTGFAVCPFPLSDQRGSDKHLWTARGCLPSPSTHIPRFLDEYIPSSLSLWVSVTETHI